MALSLEGFRCVICATRCTLRICYGKVRISKERNLNVVVWWVESPASSSNSTIKVAAQARRTGREPIMIILALIYVVGRMRG